MADSTTKLAVKTEEKAGEPVSALQAWRPVETSQGLRPALRFTPAKLAFNQRRIQLWPEGFERNHPAIATSGSFFSVRLS